jgi:SAM-dependent methyltransferase
MKRLQEQSPVAERGLKSYWDAVWGSEPKWRKGFGIEPTRFEPLTSKVRDGSYLLDVGGGRGELLMWLWERDVSFSGTVFDASAVAAKAVFDKGFRGLYGDCCVMPLADDLYDNVIAGNLLTSLPDPKAAVNEMIRVCKPGGWISISVGYKFVAHKQNVWQIEISDFEEWLPGCECSYVGDKVHIICHWRKP